MATRSETYVGIDVSKDRLDVAVVNPARVRQFARACSLLAKTDKLDAESWQSLGERCSPGGIPGKAKRESN